MVLPSCVGPSLKVVGSDYLEDMVHHLKGSLDAKRVRVDLVLRGYVASSANDSNWAMNVSTLPGVNARWHSLSSVRSLEPVSCYTF